MSQVKAGYEPVDNTPVEVPTRLRLPQSRTEQMREFIRREMSLNAQEAGHESFEEADDIEPDDEENMPLSPYELHMLEPSVGADDPLTKPGEGEALAPVGPAPSPEGKASPTPEAPNGAQ